MHKKWVRILFRRRVLVILLLLLQAALMALTVFNASLTYRWIYNLLYVVSLCVVLHIITAGGRSSYKLLWSVMILLFPLFGGLLYLLVRLQGVNMAFRRRLQAAESNARPFFAQDDRVTAALDDAFPAYSNQCRFLTQNCGFQAFYNEKTDYLSPGEVHFERLLTALESADRFIFLEYFIIEEGRVWSSILDILKKKAAQGVDVRLIYDDLGCFFLLPIDYQKTLASLGIRCVVFNKFRPVLSTLQNNRDHRKIAVVDGRIAFTGGVNLADEYINAYEKHGHWKDAVVQITGLGVNSLTLMFLEMWQALTGEQDDIRAFLPWAPPPTVPDGFIIPFCDSPIDDEYVSEQVYMNLINGARQYLYIQTPYLIIDDTMTSAIILAAKNGVDVRIITPHIPDKRYVHMTTRSYYRELIAGGVKIYEYSPGFIHSKVLVADDKVATVGTINMDCRSLYLHFECGVWLCGSRVVPDIRQDFMKTLERCEEITLEKCRIGLLKKLIQNLFRLFAPLM